MIKAIIFDFFDVLRTDGFNRWLRAHDLTHDGEILAATQKHDRGEYNETEFFDALGKLSGQNGAQVHAECEANNELNAELVDYIRTLRDTYKIALLSNSASAYLRAELAKYDLEQYFDVIAISSEIGAIKPEPAIFAYILRELDIRADECVFTDDNPRYVAGAEKAGIRGIAFTSTADFKHHLDELLSGKKS